MGPPSRNPTSAFVDAVDDGAELGGANRMVVDCNSDPTVSFGAASENS